MKVLRYGVVFFILFSLNSALFAWKMPDIGLKTKGKKESQELNSSISDEEYKKVMSKIRLTRDVIDRFLEVYPRYKSIVEKCAPDEDVNSPTAAQKCAKKLLSLLKKYNFSVEEFGGVITRLAYAYAQAQMSQNNPIMGAMSGMFNSGLTSTGQRPVAKDELRLVKEYVDRLEKIFGRD